MSGLSSFDWAATGYSELFLLLLLLSSSTPSTTCREDTVEWLPIITQWTCHASAGPG